MSHSTDSSSSASRASSCNSEITSGGTESELASSETSSEENNAIARGLKMTSHSDIYTESFKVHSIRLQRLLESECELSGISKADAFFEDVMQKTETYISWPKEITNDSSKRNDPSVHVCGKQDDISWAKGLILNRLQTSDKQLKLRIIIPNNDHRFIVGWDNNNLTRIMEFSDTIIELPYSNQKTLAQKGNQVVIEGTVEGIELARVQLRSSMPIIMSFKIPSNLPELCVDAVKKKYNVQVIVTDQDKSAMVSVRSSSRRINILKEAIRELINVAYKKCIAKPLVTVQMEIPPPYQDFIKGENNEKLLNIMKKSKTKIYFPDLVNAMSQKRSHVTILGVMDNACEARNKLVSNFPVELVFDTPGYYQYNATDVFNIGTKFGVHITVAQKDEGGLTIAVKGIEKKVQKVYEVYQDIISLQSAIPDNGDVPKAFYHLEGAYQRVMGDLTNKYLYSVVERTSFATGQLEGSASVNDNYSYSYLQAIQTGGDLGKFCLSQLYGNPIQENTTSTPDSGYGSIVDFRSEIQAIDWSYTPDARHESEADFRAEIQSFNWPLLSSDPLDSFSRMCFEPSDEKTDETICNSTVTQVEDQQLSQLQMPFNYDLDFTMSPAKERDVFADLRNGISPGNYPQ